MHRTVKEFTASLALVFRAIHRNISILQDRLRNDPATERQVVRAELGKINDLRLARLMGARERAS